MSAMAAGGADEAVPASSAPINAERHCYLGAEGFAKRLGDTTGATSDATP